MRTIPHRMNSRQGFTLVEVILAIGISVGILVVALVFYNQAANLRNQLLAEAENVSSIRLAMDRLSLELQTAFLTPQQGFVGTADSMEFTTSGALDPKAWNRTRSGRSEGPVTDLKLVSYRVVFSIDEGANLVVDGLERSEEPLVIGARRAVVTNSAEMAGLSMPGMTNRPGTGSGSNALAAGSTTNQNQGDLLNRSIRQARFRYWGGGQWVENWNQAGLPQGVEITFSPEPAPVDSSASEVGFSDFGTSDSGEPGAGVMGASAGGAQEDSSQQLYRRVVYLPGAASAVPAGGGISL